MRYNVVVKEFGGATVLRDLQSDCLASRGASHLYMGCSTFSEYTVAPEIALAKINKAAPLEKACLLGCGVTTGIGAVMNTARVETGSTVAVFGLGGIGLSCLQSAVITF